MTAAEFARGLHAIAEFYEANPNMPVPYLDTFNMFVRSKGEMIHCARMLGTCDKVVTEDWFELCRKFGPMKLVVNIRRNSVCERVKVGEREVPEQHLPAREAETVPAHTEDVYEWKCPEALLSEGGGSSKQLPDPGEVQEPEAAIGL